jgi:hypothetical protein
MNAWKCLLLPSQQGSELVQFGSRSTTSRHTDMVSLICSWFDKDRLYHQGGLKQISLSIVNTQ